MTKEQTQHTAEHDVIYGTRVSGKWGSVEISSRHKEWVDAAVARIEQRDALAAALQQLVEIIDKAGLMNLSNGVQLGQNSWYAKAFGAMDGARAALSKVQP